MREEPTLAAWLLKHFVAKKQRESLLGDLFEEYQAGRTYCWYWRETLVAICISLRSGVHEVFSWCGTRVILGLVAQLPIVWAVLLTEQYREQCPNLPVFSGDSTARMLCAGALQIAIALVVWPNPLGRPARAHRRSKVFRLSVAAFAAIGFSGGAFTWASTASCSIGSIVCPAPAVHTCASRVGAAPGIRQSVGAFESPHHTDQLALNAQG